jgi:hypothetical protein
MLMLVWILLLGIFCFFERSLLHLPARLTSLLRLPDHIRIVALGILLPLFIVLLAFELPWLHPREETIDAEIVAAALLKLASLFVAIIMLSSRQVILRLSRRGHRLGFSKIATRGLLAFGLLALANAFAATVLLKLDAPLFDELGEWLWIGFFSMLGLVLLAFLFGVILLVNTRAQKVQTATALQVLTPHLLAASFVLAAMVPIYHSIERGHVAQIQTDWIGSPESMNQLMGKDPVSMEARAMIESYLDSAPRE